MLADLSSMFPSVAHKELVTIPRSHGGNLDDTVDYLMALSLYKETEGATNVVLSQAEALQDKDSYEQFSNEIGGPPEALPSFMADESEEEDAPVNHVGVGVSVDNEDPLPPYEEAMRKERAGGYVVADCILLPILWQARDRVE